MIAPQFSLADLVADTLGNVYPMREYLVKSEAWFDMQEILERIAAQKPRVYRRNGVTLKCIQGGVR